MLKLPSLQTRLAIAALCVLFVGCAAQTESQAIAQASAAARAHGYDLRRYDARARYNMSGDGMWTVFYDARPNASGGVAVGDHFTVYVNRAGGTSIMPGR